ncbi:hypothetical protein [Agrococcus sp. Ld7]|uniref:hypothetical protein n=1 Tax=Agrococcus sp. Ld7 TaxID=649148 RepID=UPI003864188E
MTWHRADGAHPTGDGPDAADRAPVTPVPMGIARAAVHGGAAVTAAAGVAAVFLLLGTIVVGLVAEELIGDRDIDLLARGAMASLGILVVIGGLGEPLRIALERSLRAGAAERMPRGTTPPFAEREALRGGPHGWLHGVGVGGIILGAIGLPLGLFLAADDREALLARILVPSIGAVLLLGGVALVWWSRGRGRGRARWKQRFQLLSSRWGRAILPVPRAHRQRRNRVLVIAGQAAMAGALLFLAGVWMRQPGRWADPRTWGELGERAIDGLLASGALVIAIALVAVLAVQAGLLVWTAIRDRRTVQALERGERVLLERVDGVLLDDGPLERVAVSLGVLGWLVVSYGWSPTFIAGIESAEETAGIRALTALVWPGLIAVGVGWMLGSIGAVRVRARRARVQAVLARDPQPLREGDAAPSDRRAKAVGDIALHARGTILPP